jgi:hypothetical protein
MVLEDSARSPTAKREATRHREKRGMPFRGRPSATVRETPFPSSSPATGSSATTAPGGIRSRGKDKEKASFS